MFRIYLRSGIKFVNNVTTLPLSEGVRPLFHLIPSLPRDRYRTRGSPFITDRDYQLSGSGPIREIARLLTPRYYPND